MIIGATRIRSSSGHRAVLAHVTNPAGNEQVTVARGSQADVAFAVRIARSQGAAYCLRHYHISPAGSCNPTELGRIILDLSEEFRFDPLTAYVVCHEKRRASGSGAGRHWHVLVPEVDAVTLRVLDSRWMRPRHELVARRAEIRLGHSVTRGRWNTAVLRRLAADGDQTTIAALTATGFDDGDPGAAAYGSTARKVFERRCQGENMPALVTAVAAAWRRSSYMSEFLTILSRENILMRWSDTKGWILDVGAPDTGVWSPLGSLARLVRARRTDVEMRIAKWERIDAKLAAEADTLGERRHLGIFGRDVQLARPPAARPSGFNSSRIRGPGSGEGEHHFAASIEPLEPTRGRRGSHWTDDRPNGIDRYQIGTAGNENAPDRRRLENALFAISFAAAAQPVRAVNF